MRNQALIGYVLHHKAYQEKRAIYYLFSPTHGVVHGVGKKGVPLLTPVALFATGKGGLKTFSQLQPQHRHTHMGQITGQNLYGALYLNELLWRVLTTEDPMPVLWWAYQQTLMLLINCHHGSQLSVQDPTQTSLSLAYILRCFESLLFVELGYGLSFLTDKDGNDILPTQHYCYDVNKGWVKIELNALSHMPVLGLSDMNKKIWLGANILTLATINEQLENLRLRQAKVQDIASHAVKDNAFLATLDALFVWGHFLMPAWTQLHRQVVDSLVDYQPLQSRKLWQQQRRFLSS